MKRVILAFVFLIAISMPVFAEEIRHEIFAPYPGMVAYYGVDSGKFYLAYNPEEFRAVFRDGSFIQVDRAGFLKIKYMQGGQLREFGTLSGLIIADSAGYSLEITNGEYNPPATNANRFKILGKKFRIDASNPSRALFIIEDGAYMQDSYFFGCKFICDMVLISAPAESYLNITGEGFISKGAENLREYLNNGFDKMQEAVDKCMETDPGKCELAQNITDMREIALKTLPKFEIEARPSGEPETFGRKGDIVSVAVTSWLKVKMKAVSDDYSLLVLEGANAVLTSPFENYGMTVKRPGNFVSANVENMPPRNNIAMLTSGGAFIFIGGNLYPKCKENKEPYNGMGCIYFDEPGKKLHIKPRATTGSNAMPFRLGINLPSYVEEVILEPFDAPAGDAVMNAVTLNKEGTRTQIAFYNNDIIVAQGGNWFDLGISFKSYILPKDNAVSGEQPLGFYDRFECKNPTTTKDCYLNGERVAGFTEARTNYRCASDDDCGSGKKCIERLCVIQSACTEVPGYNGNGFNMLFISDEYPEDNAEFKTNIDAVLNGDAQFKGLIDIEPFSSNIGKFNFYMMNGGYMPTIFTIGHNPAEVYMQKVVKQCATAENIMVISKKAFLSYAKGGGGTAFIAQQNLRSVSHGKSLIAVHEFGHSFGGVRDEYYTFNPASGGIYGKPNCVPYDCEGRAGCDSAKTLWGEELANEAKSKGWTGCGGNCDRRCANLLRPRLNSIMNEPGKNIILPDDPESAIQGRGDTFSEPALKQIQERIACIGAATPCMV
ncbi:MAG: M64 family metallopeptidase [Nanoarchaeota archaeon]|nr:M64 family metallopeptidase [Nanoarchaeota archaeon]